MPFGVPNAPALIQELMNKIPYIRRRRPLVQGLVSRGPEMEAHIDDVSLDTNTQEEDTLLLQEFFTVCQENHLRMKLAGCQFMLRELEYLGFGNKPHLRFNHCRTCRYVTTLRRVCTTSGVVLVPAIFIGVISRFLRIHQPP